MRFVRRQVDTPRTRAAMFYPRIIFVVIFSIYAVQRLKEINESKKLLLETKQTAKMHDLTCQRNE